MKNHLINAYHVGGNCVFLEFEDGRQSVEDESTLNLLRGLALSTVGAENGNLIANEYWHGEGFDVCVSGKLIRDLLELRNG